VRKTDAARHPPSPQPLAASIVDVPQVKAFEALPQCHNARLEPHLLADHQFFAADAGRLEHRQCVVAGGGHRLFAKDVLAGIERCNRHLGMQRAGAADVDDVDARVVEHAAVIGVAPLNLKIVADPFGGRGIGVGHGDQFGFGDSAPARQVLVARDGAGANQADAQFCKLHGVPS
jgi:hypothetical protein